MGRGQPTSGSGGATPASSQIIFLEQRIAELEATIERVNALSRYNVSPAAVRQHPNGNWVNVDQLRYALWQHKPEINDE